MGSLYDAQHLTLAKDNSAPEFNSSIFDRVAKWLHEKRGFRAEMLSEPPARDLINETYRVLRTGIGQSITQEVPAALTAALERDTFVFSGFKTYHELREASRLLKDSSGGFKPFETFQRDVQHLNKTYNRNYLRAEYNFAVQSAQMAVKWSDFEQDGDRYLLQYRTAGDEKVRDAHAALHNTTLPLSDPFWDNFLPPLGWNCRCTAVQVRRGKYPVSDSKQAIAAGKAATASPRQQIFRFNPGKQQKVFPPKHPYLPKGCAGCTNNLRLAYDANSERCKACAAIAKAQLATITPQSNRPLFRQLQQEAKDTFTPFPDAYIHPKGTYTRHLYFGKKDFDALIGHCYTAEEIEAVKKITPSMLMNLQDGKYEPLNTHRKNIRKKLDAGVIHFVAYDITIDGVTFELKTEAIKNNECHSVVVEHPYYMAKKERD